MVFSSKEFHQHNCWRFLLPRQAKLMLVIKHLISLLYLPQVRPKRYQGSNTRFRQTHSNTPPQLPTRHKLLWKAKLSWPSISLTTLMIMPLPLILVPDLLIISMEKATTIGFLNVVPKRSKPLGCQNAPRLLPMLCQV